MQATSFDFDVITGPSTPRDERGAQRPPEPSSPAQPTGTPPAAPQAR